ncbi:MAG: C10 family peptidase [Bacteroidales bacterium]|nr:C10 family peptidase [Bacteroidales bacterium]
MEKSCFLYHILISFIIFFVASSCSSLYTDSIIEESISQQTIPLETALKTLDCFLVELGMDATKSDTNHCIIEVQTLGRNDFILETKQSDCSLPSFPDSLFYLVNYADDGFALLAANTALRSPVLALVDKGSIQSTDLYESLLSLCLKSPISNSVDVDSSKRIILELLWIAVLEDLNGRRTNETIVPTKSISVPCFILNKYGPFLNTKWDQYSPFNDLCDSNAAGCCAIAVAQIVVSNKVAPSMVFDGVTCSWADMESVCHYTSPWNIGFPNAQNQVAHFIKLIRSHDYCRITSDYGNSVGAKRAFKKFGYKNVTRHLGTSGNNTISTIKQCLQNGRPVYVDGVKSGSIIGHCWVLDGYVRINYLNPRVNDYVEKELFHINWGWNGTYDGYYQLHDYDVSNSWGYDDQIDSLTHSYTNSSVYDNNYTWDIWAVTYTL